MPSIADRLKSAKNSAFVGREAERALFQDALTAAPELPPPFSLLYMYGPGGVGKSSLIGAYAEICAASGVPFVSLDARRIEPTPGAFAEALRTALSLSSEALADPFAAFAAPGRQVLLLDTYEQFAALDGWLREVCLPQFSADVLVVIAGRGPLPPAWLSDAGWQSVVRVVPLRNLSPTESRAFLTRRAVPESLHGSALDWTHGHPLALSLLAEVLMRGGGSAGAATDTLLSLPFTPEAVPDVVQALLARFLENIPDTRHRIALETCALARVTDESLLRAVVLAESPSPALVPHPAAESPPLNDAGESGEAETLPPLVPPPAPAPGDDTVRGLFEWLRGLSFIESGAEGLFPHDVVRETLLADLRWRDRERYVALHRRARDHFAARLREASAPREQQRLLYDCIFLHRDNAVIRAAFSWQETQSVYPDRLLPSDIPFLAAMTREHEGAETAALAETCWKIQPDQTVVFRDLAEPGVGGGDSEGTAGEGGPHVGPPVGYFTMLTIDRQQSRDSAESDDTADGETDPAVVAARRYLQTSAPLRSGETASFLRFWMARDSYQMPSPVQSLIIVHALRHFLTHSHLAFTFFACAEPDLWEPVFDYVGIARLRNAEFTIGGKTYGVYGHDWRALPASAWLEGLFVREVAAGGGGGNDTVSGSEGASSPAAARDKPPVATGAPLLVLSEPEFAAAVRDALKAFHKAGGLHASPLIRSRLVVGAAAAGEGTVDTNTSAAARSETLREIIREQAARLSAAPRQARGYRALLRTYLEPVGTQEQAADLLDLPFNTYRRHLGEGITALTELLWQKEIGEGG